MTHFILIQRAWEFSKNFGRQTFWNLSQRDFNDYFQRKEKLEAKYAFLLKKKKTKKPKPICNLD